MTEWKPVGFGWGDLYEVCRDGRIRRIGSTKILGVKSRGYVRVHFCRNNVARIYAVHKVVADAFLGPKPAGKPSIDHINGDRADNRVENLRYCTPQENNSFTIERGANAIGTRHGMSVLTREQVSFIRRLKAERGRYWGAEQIAKQFGVSRSAIGRAVNERSYHDVAAAIRSGGGE
ncbi:MAG: HNH endonuclease [Rhizobiales bacterium]|nr:HNH endonuclease [Hyphomicrobiales bacterium]